MTDSVTLSDTRARPKIDPEPEWEQGRRPCRDYDEDCDDMTVAEICACKASTHPEDDLVGYCVLAQRCN